MDENEYANPDETLLDNFQRIDGDLSDWLEAYEELRRFTSDAFPQCETGNELEENQKEREFISKEETL